MIRLGFLLWFAFACQAIAGGLPKPTSDGDFRSYPEAQVKLGQLLFYDRVLSGSYLVSCGTCHNHDRATSNGPRLDGEVRSGDSMAVDNLERYLADNPSARHAPPLFNLGAKEFVAMFGDGRVAELADGSFSVPEGVSLPNGLQDVLAAQALFPAVTPGELAVNGRPGRHGDLWDVLAARVADLAGYEAPFAAAYPRLDWPKGVTITHIANAIGAFVGTEWRADNAPFDQLLRGQPGALDDEQKRGLELFYGKAGCDACHSGAFQTDHDFHAVATPAFPTDTDLTTGLPDVPQGRFAVTGEDGDLYAVRTPPLRNIVQTPPYGREGAYEMLEAYLRHHLDPLPTMRQCFRDRTEAKLPEDVAEMMGQLSARNVLSSVDLSDTEIDDLLAFLGALTDENSLKGRLGKPDEVPSNLEMD